MKGKPFDYLLEFSLLTLSQIAVYFAFKYLNSRDSLTKIKNLTLNSFEATIIKELIEPKDLDVSFEDIGGMEAQISNLQETVIYPLLYPQLFQGLLGPPKGVLLYGPPGY